VVAIFVVAFIAAVANALSLAIFVRVILSWLPGVRLPFGIGEFAWNISEPLLAPIRRSLPMTMGIDFSPLIVLFAIQLAQRLLLQLVGGAL
jgi:YggT family protein